MLIDKDKIDWKLYRFVTEEKIKSCEGCCFLSKNNYKCSIIGHMDCTNMIFKERINGPKS